MIQKIIAILFVLLSLLPGASSASDKIQVFTSIVPQKYFVQQISKDLVTVHTMVQPGASPATYEPKPKQMVDLLQTQIYFAIGVPFENSWLGKITTANPDMKVVYTDHGIDKLAMSTHDHPQSGHDKKRRGQSRPHIQNGLDPHIWLSPPLVKIQAHTILNALQEVDPAHHDVYRANFDRFMNRLDQLDNDLTAIFSDKQGLRFLVFHPAWGYFANAYGLEQVPIEIEGKAPKAARLQTLIQLARKKGISMILAQPRFSVKSAQLVARQIGGHVVFADPLAEDWMRNLQAVAEMLAEASR